MQHGWLSGALAVALVATLSACATGNESEAGAGGIAPVVAASSQFELGDCIDDVTGGDGSEGVTDIPVVPCSGEHDSEVFAITALEEGDYPGDESVDAIAGERCAAEFSPYVGVPATSSSLGFSWYAPTADGWRVGDHDVVCVAFDYDPASGAPMRSTGTVRGSGR
jgi:hypothetical protein